jgi:bifunctional ADP-heptose synthase (sugar kinase/adenylyltransferase)
MVKIKEKFNFKEFEEKLDLLKDLKVFIIGDCVVDTYSFVNPDGRAMKDPILSAHFKSEESYAGGVLAVANHLSSYVNALKLVTLIGDKNSHSDFIKDSLSKNINLKTFIKKNSPTTIKKRYIDAYKGNKLFKVEYMNDFPISEELSNEIENYLYEELPKYDLVIVLDYDHGFMNKKIRKILQEKSKFLCLNSQVNSANIGYNYINKYRWGDFIVMNERELRLPLMMKFEGIEEVINEFYEKFKQDKFLITLGKKGCVFSRRGRNFFSEILTNKLVDTVGAGDAVFSIMSLMAYLKIDEELMPFIANCVGGIGANILGNKESVTKDKLLNFIGERYNELE